MTEFNKEQALHRYIELSERRYAEFEQLPDFQRRIARGDYQFFSSVDIELDELQQEAQRNGFLLDAGWDGNKLVYTIEQMTPEEHEAYLAEEQEQALEDLKWRYSEGLLEP
ncbi:hypothetical protein KSD_10500 [Ktedonobacter sp. SOSP1-85]|uniref:hypothetical protein n=1 Tax=Ktedonobacter sp. SOSP1-85 TaxID=2778367 RepID=UPI0019155405|nr:hypothetical protein [Ktedonobacter sp. SOSP1-85]GHO73279.1 hypothetical protein KSD_10500 [Ktedonobacter sp. SOSP1-85]